MRKKLAGEMALLHANGMKWEAMLDVYANRLADEIAEAFNKDPDNFGVAACDALLRRDE